MHRLRRKYCILNMENIGEESEITLITLNSSNTFQEYIAVYLQVKFPLESSLYIFLTTKHTSLFHNSNSKIKRKCENIEKQFLFICYANTFSKLYLRSIRYSKYLMCVISHQSVTVRGKCSFLFISENSLTDQLLL